MKKILFIITKAETGGAQKVVYSLIKGLYKNYDITLAYGQGYDLINWVKPFNIKTICIPELIREIKPLKDIIALKKLYNLIKTEKFDIVHCHSAKAGTLGRIAARFYGVKKIVYTVHGWGSSVNPYQSKFKTYIFSFIEIILSFFSTDIVCVSKADEKIGIKFKISNRKLGTIYNGVTIDIIDEVKNIRQELDILDNEVIIGTVARVAPPKDWKNSLKLSNYLKKQGINFKFLWVGDGPEFNKLKTTIKKMKLEKEFILLGNRNDVSSILENLDIFILLTNWEGLPISIIEAMHKSLPIIASNVGGNKELVFNKKNGYLIQDNSNIEFIGDKVINIVKDKELQKKLGLNSKKLANKYFSEKAMVEKYIKIFEKLNN